MFDPVTADFIRSAPALPGLDPAELVDELTAAYVDIASARLSIAVADEYQAASQLIARMSRIADTYEAQIVQGVNTAQHKAAAFVAGSARQVIARLIRTAAAEPQTSRLDADVLGSDIAAALLFLIAERTSDAFEAGRQIRAAGEMNPLRRALILTLRRFARGQFSDILTMNIAAGSPEGGSETDYAADLLYGEILEGLLLLARFGLGLGEPDGPAAADAAFAEARRLAVDASRSDPVPDRSVLEAVSVFAGPHHLASLMQRAGDALRAGAIVRVPPPAGANAERWTEWVTSEAARWPFLWQNHRDAIRTGYLDQGMSLVMTTPTGSGKSTLAALKIAATLSAGRKVIYLAPTHALVGQVERDLNDRVLTLARAENIDDAITGDDVDSLPDLSVVTPERCFALLTFSPQLFGTVGLLVFDECHLLGVSKPATRTAPARTDRRAIDAMLCLLTFMRVNASADFLLLSAMVSNGGEIADWLRALKRPAVAFEDRWKPTRQLKTCVVYNSEETRAAEASLRLKPPTKPAATPHGLFSLISGWHPETPEKLLIRPLASAPIPLNANPRGRLTANRYGVAAAIAHQLAMSGLKIIVFCESIATCSSVAKALNKEQKPLIPRREANQNSWRDAAISGVGAVNAIYDAGDARAAVHHGELLPEERRLVESTYRDRESGLNILAATSTLAQGLNLPCDAVILAGTDRLDDGDAEEKTRVSLMPHEILNALGRAGRAGLAATGLSIVVPGKPITCDFDAKTFSSHADLRVVFSDSDQCLPLSDPLAILFDQIEVGSVQGPEAQYLLRRLSASLGADQDGVEPFEALARRSLGFFKLRLANAMAADRWVSERKASLAAAIAAAEPPPSLPWHEELAGKSGASAESIVHLANAFANAPQAATDAITWVRWLLHELDETKDDFDTFLRPETLARVFGRAYANQSSRAEMRRIGRLGVLAAFEPWLAGKPLVEIEAVIATFVAAHEGSVTRATQPDVRAKRARRLAIRLAPDLGYVASLLSQIVQRLDGQIPLPMLGFLPALLRRGLQTPFHLAIFRQQPAASRCDIENAYAALAENLNADPSDDWSRITQKLDAAQAVELFSVVDEEAVEAALQAVTITSG